MHFSRNHLDVGAYGFAQQDQANFNLVTTDGSSPPITQLENPTGELLDAWLQDTYDATDWLNFTAGVRQSHFRGLVTENATDPRLGTTVKLPHLNWVLSAFWGKYYQAPPLETLSGPFVSYATTQDTSFLPLHGERDTERQFGVTIPVDGLDCRGGLLRHPVAELLRSQSDRRIRHLPADHRPGSAHRGARAHGALAGLLAIRTGASGLLEPDRGMLRRDHRRPGGAGHRAAAPPIRGSITISATRSTSATTPACRTGSSSAPTCRPIRDCPTMGRRPTCRAIRRSTYPWDVTLPATCRSR